MAKKGDDFHRLVEALERTLCNKEGVQIEISKKIRDMDSGEWREHDIVITQTLNHHKTVTAIECKDWKKKVGSPVVEGFSKKCEKTGIHRGVIVSSEGFTKPALQKARALNIECCHMKDVEGFDWCQMNVLNSYVRKVQHVQIKMSTEEMIEVGADATYFFQGEEITLSLANNLAFNAINRNGFFEVPGEKVLRANVTNVSDFFVIYQDKKYIANQVHMKVLYEVIEEKVPFKFHAYQKQKPSAEGGVSVISESAVARVDDAGVSGRFVLTKSPENIKVMFIKDDHTEKDK